MNEYTTTRRINDLKEILEDINNYSELESEKIAAFRRFAGLAGVDYNEEQTSTLDIMSWEVMDLEGTIDIHAFRADMVQRGFSSRWADAAFNAFDLGKDSRINKYEYFLGVLMATNSIKLSHFTDQKWVDFRYKMIFFFYCKSDFMTIGYKEMALFLRDINTTDSKISSDLLDLDIISTHWMCSRSEFIEILKTSFPQLDINTLNMSQLSRSNLQPISLKKVTLDSRLITTNNIDVSLKTHVSTTVPTCGKAPGLIIHDDLIPEYEWPQTILYTRTDNAYKIATFILQQTIGLVYLQLNQEKMDHPSDIWINKRDILCLLLGTTDKDRHLNYIQILSEAACKIFTAQPTVVHVEPPCKIYGDIHGQFRDLLLLFSRYGFPSHRGGDVELASYVFNGDWVDRGPHQVETVLFLFALKILYPTRVYLVRGNHEFRQQNKNMSRCGSYGFDKACWTAMKGMLGNRIFQHIHNAFDMLPLLAVVDNTVAVMHGGLGHGDWTLDDIRQIQRPLYSELNNELVFHLVWSDPLPETPMDDRKGAHTSERDNFRGKIIRFASDITDSWCARNNIQLVVRSHEYNPSGFLVMHGGRLITVFSARNYMDTILNDSALLLLTYDDTKSLRIRIKTLSKKYIPAPSLSSSTDMTSDEYISEQFGKIREHSNLLDAIIIPDSTVDITSISSLQLPTSTSLTDARPDFMKDDESNETIQIDYSSNSLLCSSSSNLNDILRETNHKYDHKLQKQTKKKRDLKHLSSEDIDLTPDDNDYDSDNGGISESNVDDEKKSEKKSSLKTTFVKKLRNTVKEMFTRSISKEFK